MKKVTVKDVAKRAGVSAATVSYIMNNKPGIKISDATRKKVLQIANLMNYTPNRAAISLATGCNKVIGISYRLTETTPSRNIELLFLQEMLTEQLNRMGYSVTLLPFRKDSMDFPAGNSFDGILALDLTHEEFRQLAEQYYVPILTVDMILNDPLFYQVCTDLPEAIAKAFKKHPDAILITEEFLNKNYMEYVTKDIPKNQLFIFKGEVPEEIFRNSLKGKHLVVIGRYLGLVTLSYVPVDDVTVISPKIDSYPMNYSKHRISYDITKKTNLIINLLLNAIDRKFDVEHVHMIKIDTITD